MMPTICYTLMISHGGIDFGQTLSRVIYEHISQSVENCIDSISWSNFYFNCFGTDQIVSGAIACDCCLSTDYCFHFLYFVYTHQKRADLYQSESVPAENSHRCRAVSHRSLCHVDQFLKIYFCCQFCSAGTKRTGVCRHRERHLSERKTHPAYGAGCIDYTHW